MSRWINSGPFRTNFIHIYIHIYLKKIKDLRGSTLLCILSSLHGRKRTEKKEKPTFYVYIRKIYNYIYNTYCMEYQLVKRPLQHVLVFSLWKLLCKRRYLWLHWHSTLAYLHPRWTRVAFNRLTPQEEHVVAITRHFGQRVFGGWQKSKQTVNWVKSFGV